ncbi:MAG: HAD-IC family P-type ATPase [Candidatus Bathyarchaeota archaeon]|nr:HAD-IC family P-type ATPase [Candidatus Bathyarchaeota archaeon]
MRPTEVYRLLESGEQGLTEKEAERRLKTYGPNELPRHVFSGTKVLLRQFKNPIFAILVACAVVAGFFQQPEQAVVILSMIAIAVVLGFFNEYKAEKIVEDLRRKVSIRAVVTRDGKSREIGSREVVPGDVVSVYVGDIVPADMRIVESKDLQANESTLTGESFPVEKSPNSLDLQQPTPMQLINYLFMGTVIAYGSGKGVVLCTGRNTEFGSISRSLIRSHPETEFQKGVKSYGTMLLTLTMALTIGIFGVNAALGHPIIDSLLFSLAVAVGLVPELMPAIVTISLSQGARRMAKVKTVVKRLVSIEDFGNMNILCADKTGTMTEGQIVLKEYCSLSDEKDPRILSYSLLCNAAVVGERITGNPMDVAIWEYAKENGIQDAIESYVQVDEIPFDYQRRIMSTVVNKEQKLTLISKGAPESIVEKCKQVEGRTESLDSILESINNKMTDLASAGYRTLAVAYRTVDNKDSYSVEDESNLTLLGFLIFTDPPKKDAHEAIAKLREMGVNVKILTGDTELVAAKICKDIKVPVKKVIRGSELSQMSSVEIRKAVEEADIFALVTPEQKLDIMKALRENGHVVGFLGDGVNDAPALYEADVGI